MAEADAAYPPSFAAAAPGGVCIAIAGVPVVELVARFGTPLFVYDSGVVAARVRSLASFDVVRYAQKANSNVAVLDVVRRAGALVDATSAGEVRRALAAGFAPHEIVYTADIFDRDALAVVVSGGIAVNCGSEDMVRQYAEAMGAASVGGSCAVTLRVNPGFGHGHSNKTNTGGPLSKHGIWHEELPGVVARAAAAGVRVAGLHVHIGSGADLAHLSLVGAALERLALTVGPQLECISAGGGLPVPYARGGEAADGATLARYYELWHGVRCRLQSAFHHALRLEIEPGRYLVADAGFLLSEVRATKRAGANRFVLLDAGFNCLVRPAMYGAAHPMALAPGAAVTPSGAAAAAHAAAARPVGDFIVGGPLCESGDVFTVAEGGVVTTARLPEPAVGDVIVIGLCGAYGFSMSSTYNSRPLPAEALVDDRGVPHLIRERQRLDDLMRGECIPPR